MLYWKLLVSVVYTDLPDLMDQDKERPGCNSDGLEYLA